MRRREFISLVGGAAVHGVVSARARVAQPHVPTAAAADDKALQERAALARHTGPLGFVVADIVRQLLPIGHELLPPDIARMGVVQADGPVLGRHRDGAALAPTCSSASRIRPAAAVDVDAGIGRVLQDAEHTGAVGRSPDKLVRRRPDKWPNRQGETAPPQIAHHRLGTLELAEFGEHQPQPRLHLLVGVEHDGSAGP